MGFKLKEFQIDIAVTRIANLHYFEFVKQDHAAGDTHPFRELVFVDSGALQVSADHYRGLLCENQMLIHQTHESHYLCADAGSPNVIVIGFECLSPKLDLFSKTPYTLSAEQKKILTDIIKEGREVFLPPYDSPYIQEMKKRAYFRFGADQMIKLKLEMLLIELIRTADLSVAGDTNAQPENIAEKIGAYISTHYTEKILLDDLCFLFATNKTTLCKKFKDTYGATTVDYINKLRINQAKKLILTGDYSLTEVAARVGFSSIHYFSKTFKHHEGITPSEYAASLEE